MMRPLVLIVIAELFGTSLWFCGAMAAPELGRLWELSPAARGGLLTAVQLGFIVGTLMLSLTGLADRFPAHRIFALGCFAGAASNAALLLCESLPSALLCRFAVGLCLAGIYPLGMKLVIAWAPTSAGAALGWLVGALVLGTSTPFLLRGLTDAIDWQWAVSGASVLAVIGGMMVATLGSGHVADGGRLGWGKVLAAFRVPAFRRSAFAYFGHMWEVYAFWALVPFYIDVIWHETDNAFAYRATFAVMGIGAFGCVFGGWWSRRIGSERVATFALAASGAMCAASPFLTFLPASVAFALLLFWSIAAASDSPQFSAISAKACPPGTVGSALAVQNGIGFLLSVFAIHLVADMRPSLEAHIGWLLLPGPLLGLIAWNRRRGEFSSGVLWKLRLSAARLCRTFGWSGSRQEWTTLIGFIAWLLIGAGVWWMMRSATIGESVIYALGWLLVLLVAAWPVVRGLFGPVFYYELIRSGRQRSTIVFRCLYAAVVGCTLTMMYVSWVDDGKKTTVGTNELARFGTAFFYTFASIQYIVVVLLTPVYVGGAIAIEKERKTLEFLLATDLRNREILFGKLIVRVMWLLTFVLAGLPLLALVQLFGGVDPEQLIASFVATVVTVIGLSAVAIWMSTMMRKARDAILLTFVGFIAYVIGSYMLMALVIGYISGTPSWIMDICASIAAGNILWNIVLLEAGSRIGLTGNPGILLREFTLFWLLVGSLCLGHAILRLRAVTLNQSYGPQGATKSKTRKVKTKAGKFETAIVNESTKDYPEIGDNPVFWREVFVEGNSRMGCVGRVIIYTIGVLIFVPVSIIIWHHLIYPSNWTGRVSFGQRWHEFSMNINRWVRTVSGIIATLMFFAISMRAAGAISGERDKDSWISLMSTPLSADEILWGKWWGCVFGMRRIYLVFAIIWSIGLAIGGVRPEMFPLMILSLAIYVSAFSWIGLFCSMTARTTMIATVRAFFATLFFAGGFWAIIGACNMIPISLFRVTGDPYSMEATSDFFYSLTPSFMVGWLPLLNFNSRELSPFDRTENSCWLLPGLGLISWLAFNIIAFRVCQIRFRSLRQSE